MGVRAMRGARWGPERPWLRILIIHKWTTWLACAAINQ